MVAARRLALSCLVPLIMTYSTEAQAEETRAQCPYVQPVVPVTLEGRLDFLANTLLKIARGEIKADGQIVFEGFLPEDPALSFTYAAAHICELRAAEKISERGYLDAFRALVDAYRLTPLPAPSPPIPPPPAVKTFSPPAPVNVQLESQQYNVSIFPEDFRREVTFKVSWTSPPNGAYVVCIADGENGRAEQTLSSAGGDVLVQGKRLILSRSGDGLPPTGVRVEVISTPQG